MPFHIQHKLKLIVKGQSPFMTSPSVCLLQHLPAGLSLYPLIDPIVFPTSHDAPQLRICLSGWSDPLVDAACYLIICASTVSLHMLSCKCSPRATVYILLHLHTPGEVGSPFSVTLEKHITTCTEESME